MAISPGRRLRLDVVRSGGSARIIVAGDLDRASVGELKSLGDELCPTTTHLSVDLVAASVIDSAALGVLIELRRSAADLGVDLDIVIGPPFQQKLFDTTGLSDYFSLVQAP